MKIDILVPFLNNFGLKGFYQSQEMGLANAFYSKGHDVQLYKCVKGEEESSFSSFSVFYKKVKSFGTHAIFNPSSFFERIPDVLICFSDTQLILPTLVNYCKKNSISIFLYAGVTESVDFSKTLKKVIMDFIYKNHVMKAYRRCDFIFCKNRETYNFFIDRIGDDEKIIYNPIGINLEMLNDEAINASKTELRAEYGFGINEKIIIFVGRLNEEKSPLKMFEIIDKLSNNYKLIIIGNGEQKEKVLEIGEKYGDRFKYFEQVAYSEMWKFYVMSDYYVNLWDKEIFGMAILEAIYYKLPAFMISAPGPRVICEELKNSFIFDKIDEISDSINSYEYCEEFAKNDRDSIIRRFDWSVFEKNVNDCLKAKGVVK